MAFKAANKEYQLIMDSELTEYVNILGQHIDTGPARWDFEFCPSDNSRMYRGKMIFAYDYPFHGPNIYWDDDPNTVPKLDFYVLDFTAETFRRFYDIFNRPYALFWHCVASRDNLRQNFAADMIHRAWRNYRAGKISN